MMDKEVHLLVAGKNCGGRHAAGSQSERSSRVLVADADAYADGLPENIEILVVSLAKEYGHVVAPATAFAAEANERVAAAGRGANSGH